MFGYGTAHHQCAVWCAIGGIPVSIHGDDGNVYVVLRIEGDDASVANPRIVTIQTHQVTVDGDLTAGYVVPESVVIHEIPDSPEFGYIYVDNRPVVVKMDTRKVVYVR